MPFTCRKGSHWTLNVFLRSDHPISASHKLITHLPIRLTLRYTGWP